YVVSFRGACGAAGSGPALRLSGTGEHAQGGQEQPQPVVARTRERIGSVLRVPHEPHDPPVRRGDTRDLTLRADGVVAFVAEHHPAFTLEFIEYRLRGLVAALPRFQRNQDLGAGFVAGGPGGIGGLDAQPLVAADEMQALVAGERTRQQPGLAQHLETVTDTEYRHTFSGSLDHGAHHGCEPGDGTAAQIVAVGETTGDHDRVHAFEVGVAMPEVHRLGAGQPDGAGGVHVVEGAREGDDPDMGGHETRTTFQSSITVLASSDSAIAAIWSSLISSPTSSSNRLPCRTSVTPSNPRRG